MQTKTENLKCHQCNYEIKEEKAKKAMGKIFHVNCIRCVKCKKIIQEWYHSANNVDALCNKCVEHDPVEYAKLQNVITVSSTTGDPYNASAPICFVCKTPIQGRFAIKVNNKMMHNGCFVCSKCGQLIKDYYQTDDKDHPICQNCVLRANSGNDGETICVKCKKSIEEESFIPFWGAAFHERCFRCSICGRCLIKRALRLLNGRLTCAGHLLQDEKQIAE